MNFEETIVGRLTEVYQAVHLKEFTDFPKKDEKDPTKVFTDIHFKKKSVAHEAYHYVGVETGVTFRSDKSKSCEVLIQ